MRILKNSLIIILVLTSCILLGSVVLVKILSTIGITSDQLQNLGSLKLSEENIKIFKIAFGANHFISFIVSGSILIFLFSKNKIAKYTGIDNPFDFVLLFKLIVLLVLTYPIYGLIIGLINQVNLPEWANTLDDNNLEAMKQVLQMNSFGDFLINFLIIAGFAGFGEEMIFRGVIQKELYGVTSTTWSIVISAFLFSALHFEFTGFLPKFLIGVVLGYAYFLTKNLLYPILMHTFNNGFQLLILYLSGNNLEQTESNELSLASALGSLLFVPIIYFMVQHLKKYSINGSNA